MSTIPMNDSAIPTVIQDRLKALTQAQKKVVLMTCGLAGSGKSTLSHSLINTYPSFMRLSIDTIIFDLHGTHEKDYTTAECSAYQEEAENMLLSRLKSLLREGISDVVLDLSFYSREWRDEYREIVKSEGRGEYAVVLVVFRGSEEVLWGRIEARNGLFGNGQEREGMVVEREMLRGWIEGFEWPDGEDEIVLRVV